jgi:hypothetical protein
MPYNASNCRGRLQRQYGPPYQNAARIMGGRVMTVGFRLDF